MARLNTHTLLYLYEIRNRSFDECLALKKIHRHLYTRVLSSAPASPRQCTALYAYRDVSVENSRAVACSFLRARLYDRSGDSRPLPPRASSRSRDVSTARDARWPTRDTERQHKEEIRRAGKQNAIAAHVSTSTNTCCAPTVFFTRLYVCARQQKCRGYTTVQCNFNFRISKIQPSTVSKILLFANFFVSTCLERSMPY